MSFGSICDIQKVRIERLGHNQTKWSLKGNRMNTEEKEVCHQERRSAWCGVQGGQGECWCWWRSVEYNSGEQSQAKERRRGLRSTYPAEYSSMFNIHERGGRWRVWNGMEALLLEAKDGLRSADWYIDASIQTEKPWRGLRSTYSIGRAPLGRGGYEAAHHV